MKELIDKAAVVAEIEKVADEPAPSHDQQCSWEDGYYCGLYKVMNILDTLEVKEVDLDELLSNLDKDMKEFVTTQEFEKDSAVYGHYWAIAKHAFLFGLKVKGE